MAEEASVGCARPTGSVVGAKPTGSGEAAEKPAEQKKESVMSSILVGRPAPDFVAPAYRQGKFTQVKLSDYLGKWVMLCFYPGDFTFV